MSRRQKRTLHSKTIPVDRELDTYILAQIVTDIYFGRKITSKEKKPNEELRNDPRLIG